MAVFDKKEGKFRNGNGTDRRKQSLYFPRSMLEEIEKEAQRLDRPLSWVVQQAWRIARLQVMTFPSHNDIAP